MSRLQEKTCPRCVGRHVFALDDRDRGTLREYELGVRQHTNRELVTLLATRIGRLSAALELAMRGLPFCSTCRAELGATGQTVRS